MPTIFEWTQSPKKIAVARKSRLLKRQQRTETAQSHQDEKIIVVNSALDLGETEMVDVCNLEIGAEEIVGEFGGDVGAEVIGCSSATEEEANNELESVKQPYLSFERIKDNDKLVNHYTGLDSTATFLTVFWSLERGA